MLSNPKLWNPYSGRFTSCHVRQDESRRVYCWVHGGFGWCSYKFIDILWYTLYIDLIRRWVCRYVRGDVDTSSLAGDTAFAYDTSSVNTHEKHDSPRSRNSDISRKVKSTRALEKNITYIHITIHPKLCIWWMQLNPMFPETLLECITELNTTCVTMNAFRKSFEGHGRRRLNMFNTSFENSKRALFREQKEDKHPTNPLFSQ